MLFSFSVNHVNRRSLNNWCYSYRFRALYHSIKNTNMSKFIVKIPFALFVIKLSIIKADIYLLKVSTL